MKKSNLFLALAAIVFAGAVAFASCERQDDTIVVNKNSSSMETWRCIGQSYEYIGNGTDSLSDPFGNPAFRLVQDSLFIITANVFPNKDILYSKVVNFDTTRLFFKDNTWTSYSFPTTYGSPTFFIDGYGPDSSSIAPLEQGYRFDVLRHTADTLSISYLYQGPWNGNIKLPCCYYMFTRIRN